MMLELLGQERVAEYRRDAEQAGLAKIVRRRARRARRYASASGRVQVAPRHPAGRAVA
ncbi:MAG TPA: hypothetical protein VG276_18550 [Actinomycetes bacterium]|nr:hypothetical protein [Actinomycetes bacterium]